jgi:fatty-acyl-CoA synthase
MSIYESFATAWERAADATPDAPAVVQGDRRVRWGDIEQRAARFAAGLEAAGAGPNTHIALYQFNAPEYMECLFACSKLRAVAVNVNFRYLEDELAYLIDNADAEILVYHRQLAPHVAATRDRLRRVHTFVEIDDGSDEVRDEAAHDYEELIAVHAPVPRRERSGDDQLLWYTGGTTGMPKGVIWKQGTLMSHGLVAAYAIQPDQPPIARSLDAMIDDVKRWRERGTSISPLVTTPLVHATAVHQANTAFCVGGTIVLLERGRIDGDVVCRTIERERPNVLQVVGDTVVRRIVRALRAAEARGEPYDISSIRRIHNSGAMVSAEMKDAMLSRGEMHVYDSLGSSEAVGFGIAVTSAPGEAETARFRLGPNARLIDADDHDIAAGSGVAGVLAVRNSTSEGYYNDPTRNAITFRVIDGEPYVIPGDWALLEADGTLTLLGRGSNCINTGGEKVWPEEVEESLKEHPSVGDAAVLGIPDEDWGEIVGAVVALAHGRDATDAPTAEELSQWVAGRLAHYKRPRRVVVVDEVQRTTVGKVDYDWARSTLS